MSVIESTKPGAFISLSAAAEILGISVHTAAAFALRALALPLAGRLSDGAMLFDAEGLRQRASRAVRS